jgi:lipopolysaccharide/colanic/teichoic acid biosynthesis glycosyltransferase
MLSNPITIRDASAQPSSPAEEEEAWKVESTTNIFNEDQEAYDFNYELTDLPIPLRWQTLGARGTDRLLATNRRSLYQLCKRGLDIAVSLGLLLLSLPLFVIVAILIKATSRGPVIFKQKRLGRKGHEFLCLKFRTMYADAEERLRQDTELRQQFEESFKINGDPRITPVGAFLRRSSIDELPQLLHVLRGEMSLIGPRPIVKPELSKYSIYGKKLLSVKPGLGGLWQACGRSEVTYAQRVLLDMHYIDHRCLLLDIQLMFLTALAVFKGHGAC